MIGEAAVHEKGRSNELKRVQESERLKGNPLAFPAFGSGFGVSGAPGLRGIASTRREARRS